MELAGCVVMVRVMMVVDLTGLHNHLVLRFFLDQARVGGLFLQGGHTYVIALADESSWAIG